MWERERVREGWDVLYTVMCVPEAVDTSRSTLILYSIPARDRWTRERKVNELL